MRFEKYTIKGEQYHLIGTSKEFAASSAFFCKAFAGAAELSVEEVYTAQDTKRVIQEEFQRGR